MCNTQNNMRSRDFVTLETIRGILETGTVDGGMSSPDMDVVQVRDSCEGTVYLFLDKGFGDLIPSDEDILAHVVSAGDGPSEWFSTPVMGRREF